MPAGGAESGDCRRPPWSRSKCWESGCDGNSSMRQKSKAADTKSKIFVCDRQTPSDRQTDGARDSHTTTSNISTQEEDEVLDWRLSRRRLYLCLYVVVVGMRDGANNRVRDDDGRWWLILWPSKTPSKTKKEQHQHDNCINGAVKRQREQNTPNPVHQSVLQKVRLHSTIKTSPCHPIQPPTIMTTNLPC